MSAQLNKSLKYQGSLIRPKFAPGIMLLDEDLTAAVEYPRALTRLLFRSLFGCGVVCGFKVEKPIPDPCGNLTVVVNPGIALDGHGDPIELRTQQILGWPCVGNLNSLWLVICRSGEKSCAPRDVACPGDGGKATEPTRTTDCFELKLVKDKPDDACLCQDPPLKPEASGTSASQAGTEASNDPQSGAAESAASQMASNDPQARVIEPPDVTKIFSKDYWNCHRGHYCGECNCGCCGDECVVLARLDRDEKQNWSVHHEVRRFIRPMLAPDPFVDREKSGEPGEMNKWCATPKT